MAGGQWLVRVVVGAGMAGLGALSATWLGDHHFAWLGGISGAVSGGFAPTVFDWTKDRTGEQEVRARVRELAAGSGPADLLDPRRAVVDFVGREGELARLIAWCEDDSAGPVLW
jgi:hypothetical protein